MVVDDYGGMNSVSRTWRNIQRLHGLESGRVGVGGESCSLERNTAAVFHERYGRSVDEIVADHQRYVKRVERMRGLAIQVTTLELVESE